MDDLIDNIKKTKIDYDDLIDKLFDSIDPPEESAGHARVPQPREAGYVSQLAVALVAGGVAVVASMFLPIPAQNQPALALCIHVAICGLLD
jgi:hypothetical protein